MSGRIIGIGLAAPTHSVEQPQSLVFARGMLYPSDQRGRALDAIYRRSSVRRRGSVLLEQGESGEPVGERTNGESEAELVQNFYPIADSDQQRGPTTGARIERFGVEALPLATRAAEEALRQAAIDPATITHLVVVTCTGFQAPGVDVGLIRSLGLSADTQRVQVGFMGCHGAINGLRVASGWLGQDPSARVLLVCVELCSLHYQYGWETDHLVSNAIFADGAAAVVLVGDESPPDDAGVVGRGSANGQATGVPPTNATNGQADGGQADGGQAPEELRLVATGSRLIADSADAMTWRIGDHGFQMTLSAEVPDRIGAELPGYLAGWLAAYGLQVEDIGGWAVHPGGPRILSGVQACLGLRDEDLVEAREVLAEHGNMSSPTMLYILDRLAQARRPRPWLMLGFGPGLEIEVALLR